MIRTGLFRYVRLGDIEYFHSKGWMIVADLGIPHNAWSILMWHCECQEYNPNKDDALANDKSMVDSMSSIQWSEAAGAQHAASH